MSSTPKTYYPSPHDIVSVHNLLLTSTPLPRELIDTIIDLAGYWASITARLGANTGSTPATQAETYTAIGRHREHVLLLRCKPLCSAAADEGCWVDGEGNAETRLSSMTGNGNGDDNIPPPPPPEPRSRFPARRITWRFTSHDQGWSGERGDVYENSWTGFRGSVLRSKPAGAAGAGSATAGGGVDEAEDLRSFDSADFLAAWEGLVNSENSGGDGGGGGDGSRRVYDGEGDNDDLRVWPRGEGHFASTRIQGNARADKKTREHVVVWDFRDRIGGTNTVEALVKSGRGALTGDGVQVRALQRGDVIELYAYAFFPQWRNFVEQAEVRVEFAL